MMKKLNKNKKGITLVIVTIISSCIALVMASVFVLTSNYNSSIIRKENELKKTLNNDVSFGVNMFLDEDENIEDE